MNDEQAKFCKYCGEKLSTGTNICPKCGRIVNELKKSENSQIVINNNNTLINGATHSKNKWIALVLCIFTFCGHKFYEGKIGLGLIYLFTYGIFGIGWIIDIIVLLGKPNPYYI